VRAAQGTGRSQATHADPSALGDPAGCPGSVRRGGDVGLGATGRAEHGLDVGGQHGSDSTVALDDEQQAAPPAAFERDQDLLAGLCAGGRFDLA
jgi:hypothetical protein